MLKWIHWWCDLHFPFQHLHHLAHGRPGFCTVLNAPQSHLTHPLCLLSVLLLNSMARYNLSQQSTLKFLIDHLGKPLLALCCSDIKVPPPPDNLKQQHAEAVDVALVRDRRRHPHLRRGVARSSPSPDRYVSVLPVHQLRQAEVGHFGVEVLGVEEDVPGLYVIVDYPLLALLVQVLVEGAVLHVLVHERSHRGVEAEAVELDQVDVVGSPYRTHFGHELLLDVSLVQVPDEDLDGHGHAVGQLALVDRSESAGSQLGAVVACEGLELLRQEPDGLLSGYLVEKPLHRRLLVHY